MSRKVLPCFAALFALSVFGFSANVIPAILVRAAGDFQVTEELFASIMAVQFAGFIS